MSYQTWYSFVSNGCAMLVQFAMQRKENRIMPMHSEHGIFTRGFSSEKCIQCGKCLAGCQYRDITPKQARDAMIKITVRPKWYPELNSCI